jgi:hypothetical protein
MPELSPEGEAIAAYGAATMAALKILVVCLQANGALEHGQFPTWRRRKTMPTT